MLRGRGFSPRFTAFHRFGKLLDLCGCGLISEKVVKPRPPKAKTKSTKHNPKPSTNTPREHTRQCYLYVSNSLINKDPLNRIDQVTMYRLTVKPTKKKNPPFFMHGWGPPPGTSRSLYQGTVHERAFVFQVNFSLTEEYFSNIFFLQFYYHCIFSSPPIFFKKKKKITLKNTFGQHPVTKKVFTHTEKEKKI